MKEKMPLHRIQHGSVYSGSPCPYCPTGTLRYKVEDGSILCECDACGGQVMTEKEWEMRNATERKS
jgi:Zn ribbon nucleic-acid-binding protein